MKSTEYNPMDVDAYIKMTKSSPCFICEMIAKNPDYRHHIIFEDDMAIAFLNKYPTLYGYTLVAPRAHKEHVTADFMIDEYIALQRFIYLVAEAVRMVVPTERMYILSLGSQQGHRHIHWHVAPLPPGVPYEKQQTEALKLENGILKLSEDGMSSLAYQIRQKLEILFDIK
jgi:diadenosine tetraphosphate (Ap4A) HIT family hydrolase